MSIIEVKNISKKYIIGNQKTQYNSLRDDLVLAIKKPINWVKGARNQKEEFWALKDINFSVEKGEVLGIIGANGAGKSTLLKILSRITPPTEGTIKMKGRVGSLLEVGTGFHPELTGRENIYLNGAILGMKRKEIAKKFNEIVNFAGIEKFLDTPVKHYSSGMHVRLAFSVAAHLEPDVLIVDEVLAVGDAEFQKKCLGKMEEITKKDGRTILFVSHNMVAIKKICSRVILFKNGEIQKIGNSTEVIDNYLGLEKALVGLRELSSYRRDAKLSQEIIFNEIKIINERGLNILEIEYGEKFGVEIIYTVNVEIKDALVGIIIKNNDLLPIFTTTDFDSTFATIKEEKRLHGKYMERVFFSGISFKPGNYIIDVVSTVHMDRVVDFCENAIAFNIKDENLSNLMKDRVGVISPVLNWENKKYE